MWVSRRGRLLLIACLGLLAVSRPGDTQSVGSGGVSQSLAIYDGIDLGAFKNSLEQSSTYLQGQLLVGNQVTGMEFRRFATTPAGQRAYIGSFVLEPPAPVTPVTELNFFYIYVSVGSEPEVPPDRVKPTLNQIDPIFGTPIIPSPALLDFLIQVLDQPPPELLDFLDTRVLVGIETYSTNSPGSSGLQLVAEFRYEAPAALPVVVTVESDCTPAGPGGSVTCDPWIVTVN